MPTASLSAPYPRRGVTGSVLNYSKLVSVLFLKELDHRIKHPMEMVGELAEPVLMAAVWVGVRFLLSRLATPPIGDSIVLFYATGIFPDYLFMFAGRRMRGQVDSAKRRFPMVLRIDQILVHLLAKMLDYMVLWFVVFGLMFYFITPNALPWNFENVILGVCAIFAFSFFWGIVSIVVVKKFWWGFYFIELVNRATLLSSGAFYMPDFLSPTARHIISYDPICQAISLFRSGFYPLMPTLVLDRGYILNCCIFAVFFGFVLERMTRKAEER